MSGNIHPLPNTPLWRDAQLKHRNYFTFTSNIRYLPTDNLIPQQRFLHVNYIIKFRFVAMFVFSGTHTQHLHYKLHVSAYTVSFCYRTKLSTVYTGQPYFYIAY
jgi:hypothetical protein